MRGTVIQRKDGDDDRARKLYNSKIDKRPLAIVRCANIARDRDREFRSQIRDGGHNGPGLGSWNDGLIIDL